MCVLQGKLGYKVDSKSIVLPWLVRHAAHVLSRFVKRDDGRSAWARLLELLTAAEATVFRRGTGIGADAQQVVDAETQTVCQVSSWCGRRGTVLRVPG